MSIKIIYTTITRDVAIEFSRELVSRGLAACVNIVNIDSIYRWKGEIHMDDEALLIIKVSEKVYPKTYDFIVKNHPYELPEIITISPEDVFEEYEGWIKDSCQE